MPPPWRHRHQLSIATYYRHHLKNGGQLSSIFENQENNLIQVTSLRTAIQSHPQYQHGDPIDRQVGIDDCPQDTQKPKIVKIKKMKS